VDNLEGEMDKEFQRQQGNGGTPSASRSLTGRTRRSRRTSVLAKGLLGPTYAPPWRHYHRGDEEGGREGKRVKL
jgi:hypothetical protein